MWFFRSPTIVFGEDALLHIREIGDRSAGERAFVVTDQTIQKAGQLATVLFQLEHAGMQAHVFDEVEIDLTLADIKTASKAMVSFNPSWIVAVGGAHVIDAAKAMWILLENPNADLLSLNSAETIQMGDRAGFIAVPTTDGVGSATSWAITLLDAPTDGDAAAINTGHPSAIPTYAVIDPALARALSPAHIAEAGVLALAQAIESYVSTWQSDFTDGLGLTAMKLVFKYLPLAHQDPTNDPNYIEAIEKISNAAGIAGLSSSNSMVGVAYAMGRALHVAFPALSLGQAVGVCLPVVITFNVADVADEPASADDGAGDGETRYAEVTSFIGWPSKNEQDAATTLAQAILTLVRTLEMPPTLAEAGINRAQLDEAMDSLIDQVLSDTTLFTAPRQPSEDELRDLFDSAFGDTPDTSDLSDTSEAQTDES